MGAGQSPRPPTLAPARARPIPWGAVAALLGAVATFGVVAAAFVVMTQPTTGFIDPAPEAVGRPVVAAMPGPEPRRVDPDDRAATWLRMGNSLLKLGKAEAAKDDDRRILAEHPNTPAAEETWTRLGED